MTIPANSHCSLAVVKSFDAEQRLANLPPVRIVRLFDRLLGSEMARRSFDPCRPDGAAKNYLRTRLL